MFYLIVKIYKKTSSENLLDSPSSELNIKQYRAQFLFALWIVLNSFNSEWAL